MDDMGRAHGPGLARHFMPMTEQGKGRDAADIELRAQRLFRLGIDLGKPDARLQLRRRLFELRCHRPARPAPRRPEIHHHGDVALTDVLMEIRAGELDGMRSKQGLVTLPAIGAFAQARSGNAIHCIAMRANDM